MGFWADGTGRRDPEPSENSLWKFSMVGAGAPYGKNSGTGGCHLCPEAEQELSGSQAAAGLLCGPVLSHSLPLFLFVSEPALHFPSNAADPQCPFREIPVL